MTIRFIRSIRLKTQINDARNLKKEIVEMNSHKLRNALTGALVVSAVASIAAPNALAFPFGGFANPQAFLVGDRPTSVAVGDLNGDGALDLAVANKDSNTLSILLGDGVGAFATHQTIQIGNGPISIAMGDLNGDGAPDLVVASVGVRTVYILLGDGAGAFVVQQSIPLGVKPVFVAMGDLNGDGALDIAILKVVASSPYAGSVLILLGDGAGSLTPSLAVSVGNAPNSLAMSDLNGDGALDLAVPNISDNNVSVLLGDGTGGFAPQQTFATGIGPYSVATGDLNGDGVNDLAVTNTGPTSPFSAPGHTVSILLSDGAGGFTTQQTFQTGNKPRKIAMGDLNGDGALDLAVANLTSFTVSVLLGDGAGSFAPQQTYLVGDPEEVAMGDFDSDGFLDLAVGDYGSTSVPGNEVLIFINLTTPPLPGAFDLLLPADGATGLPIPDELNWPAGSAWAPLSCSAASDVATYTFTIGQDPALTSVVYQQSGLTTPNFGVPTGVLQYGARYYWGVTAVNANGSTPSTTQSFTFTTAAPADMNGNGVVNAADLANLLANWGVIP